MVLDVKEFAETIMPTTDVIVIRHALIMVIAVITTKMNVLVLVNIFFICEVKMSSRLVLHIIIAFR